MGNIKLQPAKRLSGIDPFYVMDILAKAKKMEAEGINIIHMEVGEPDFNTAPIIMNAALEATKNNISHYTPALGLPALRKAIKQYYKKHLHCQIKTDNVAVTPGASVAIQLVLSSILDVDDEVLLTDPGYPCNRHMVRLLSAKDINIPLKKEAGFLLTPNSVAPFVNEKTKALMITSPSNPTGAIYSKKQLTALALFCEKNNLHFIVDEIYQGLQYEIKPFSAAEISENIWVINSFSKYFGMTGFRVGWLIAPPYMLKAIEKLAQNLYLAPASIAQYAAVAALSDAAVEEHKLRKNAFKTRRDYLFKALTTMGFDIVNVPQGAFYLYANCSKFGLNSYQLAKKLLKQAHVAVTPGKDFSPSNADNYVRFAYTTNLKNLEKAVKRMTCVLIK